MTKARKTIVILMTITILCSLFVMVFAVDNSNAEDTNTPLIMNPFEYAQAPDGLYVFLYYGQSPYMSVEIDTSECVVGRLYVYNSTADSVIEISEQSVTAYTYTQTALYYVTEEQKIYKTDYSGTNHEYLYQSAQGDIDNLNSYFDALYFIEDQSSVILLDVANKTTQEIWTHENLSWVIMLNADQLIATMTEEDNYLYDIPTNTATIISEVEATNLITVAVKGSSSNNTRSTTLNLAAMATQQNNISFPIEPYGATPDDYYGKVDDDYYYDPPTSWFHTDPTHEGCGTGICKTYGGSSQCEGFARFAHDKYAHMENYSNMSRDAWGNGKGMVTFDYPRLSKKNYKDEAESLNLKLFLSASDAADFFDPLQTGAYVRYGKYDDDDRNDGVHSIVLVAKDDLGIWVYECNQKYDGVSGHGCGVFLQYYTYENLTKYEYILHYVNHKYSENWGYLDKDYHSKDCANCAGHVKKEHTSVSITIASISGHRATFNCCDETKLFLHTGTAAYDWYSTSQHKVRYSCCTGYVLANHTYKLGGTICTGCGLGNNIIMSIEDYTTENI